MFSILVWGLDKITAFKLKILLGLKPILEINPILFFIFSLLEDPYLTQT